VEKILIWGTGVIAEQVLRQCDVFGLYDVMGFIDNDVNKIGKNFYGRTVFAVDVLKKMMPDRIVILTVHYEEIKEQIRQEFSEITAAVEEMNFFYKQDVIKRYGGSHDPEIVRILESLEKNDLQVFNYDFVKKYKEMDFDIQLDKACGMYFVYHEGKKLYFARSLKDREQVADYYRGVLMEQDKESPHRYMDGDFCVKEGDVVVDVGVAEGNFSLQVIDQVSKLYIIESDGEWVEALKETFKNYKEKVVIIKKFITSLDSGKYATLDSLIKEPVNFIKMDIEGNEWDALLGAKKLIGQSEDLKCAICTYHGDFDEILIKDVFGKYGMKVSVTPGYMWYPDTNRQTHVSTRLCRGIVRGMKNSDQVEK